MLLLTEKDINNSGNKQKKRKVFFFIRELKHQKKKNVTFAKLVSISSKFLPGLVKEELSIQTRPPSSPTAESSLHEENETE